MSAVTDFLPLSLQRGVHRGVKSILREDGWGTALGSLFGVLFFAQILLLLVFGVQGGLRLLEEQTDLRLQINDTATDTQILDLFQNIKALPYIDDAVYITKAQAYEREKQRDPELVAFLDKFGIDNPFPETIGVRLTHLTDYDTFREFLRQPVFATVIDPAFLSQTTDQEQEVYSLIEAVKSSRYLLLFVVAVLAFAVLFVVTELVRRRALAKREELFVEQLVGASALTTFIPFCTEMAALLLSALFLSMILAAIVLVGLPFFLPALAFDGLFGTWSLAVLSLILQSLGWLIPLELLAILALAVIGTLLALKQRIQMQVLSLVTH